MSKPTIFIILGLCLFWGIAQADQPAEVVKTVKSRDAALALNLNVLVQSYVEERKNYPEKWDDLNKYHPEVVEGLSQLAGMPAQNAYQFVNADQAIKELGDGTLILLATKTVFDEGKVRRYAIWATPDNSIHCEPVREDKIQAWIKDYDIKLPSPTVPSAPQKADVLTSDSQAQATPMSSTSVPLAPKLALEADSTDWFLILTSAAAVAFVGIVVFRFWKK